MESASASVSTAGGAGGSAAPVGDAGPDDIPQQDAHAILLARRKAARENRDSVLEEHPKISRSEWRDHPAWYSSMGSHFLDIHGSFRHGLARMVKFAAGDEVSNGDADAVQRLHKQFDSFCSSLHHHHTLEEHMVFDPLLRKEHLQSEMHLLWDDHDAVVKLTEDGKASLATAVEVCRTAKEPKDTETRKAAAAEAVKAVTAFAEHLTKHLQDEEDVLVPMMLDGSLRKLTGVL